jgi:hypothetical protein
LKWEGVKPYDVYGSPKCIVFRIARLLIFYEGIVEFSDGSVGYGWISAALPGAGSPGRQANK